MAKQIAKLLKASIQETSDLKEIARMLSKKGRGGDTMLAHITPKEAALLKESGGAGTVNPDTGLLEFYDDFDFDTRSYGDSSSYYTPRASSSDLNTYYRSPSQPETGDVEPINIAQQSARFAPVSLAEQSSASQQERNFTPVPMSFEQDNVQTGGYAPFTSYAQPPLVYPDTYPYQNVEMPTPPSLVDRALVGPAKSAFEYLKENVSPTEALRLGTAAFGAVQGRRAMQEAQRQREQSVAEQRALGDPYKQMGSELQRQAQSGEMTPQSAQAFQALRAQLAQGVETRGGVGAAQAQAQLEMFRNNLLQNQFNYGLQVSQIGDQIALGAIRTGMQLDRQLLEANQNFYTNLAGFAAGGIPQGQQGRRP
jgi:hypothetical protein